MKNCNEDIYRNQELADYLDSQEVPQAEIDEAQELIDGEIKELQEKLCGLEYDIKDCIFAIELHEADGQYENDSSAKLKERLRNLIKAWQLIDTMS